MIGANPSGSLVYIHIETKELLEGVSISGDGGQVRTVPCDLAPNIIINFTHTRLTH